MYVCMYVKIRRHQHTRVHAHTGMYVYMIENSIYMCIYNKRGPPTPTHQLHHYYHNTGLFLV